MTALETWYAQVNIDALREYFRKDPDMSARLSKKQKQARSQTSEAVVPKLTAIVDGRRRIKDNPPVLFHFQRNIRDFEKAQPEPHRAVPEILAGRSTQVVRPFSISGFCSQSRWCR